MSRRLSALVLLSLLTACGVKEEKFRDKYIDATCEAMMECDSEAGFISFDSQADCNNFFVLFWGAGTEGCEYDKKAAKECLGELDSITCEGDVPSACEDVYTGSACAWGGESGGTDTGWSWDTGAK